MKIVEFFTSHAKNTTITFEDRNNFVPILDIKANQKLISRIKNNKSYEHHSSHLRIASLIVEFFHDSVSLDRETIPEIDETESDWKKEVIIRDWLNNAVKRTLEVILSKGNNEAPYLAPLEFVYTQRGLINEINLLQLLGKEFIVLEDNAVLGLKSYSGLQGGEKIIVHCEWDEYFTVFSK